MIRPDKRELPRHPSTPGEVTRCLMRRGWHPPIAFFEGTKYCRRLDSGLIRATVAELRKAEKLPRYVATLVAAIDPALPDDVLEGEWTRTIDRLRSIYHTSPKGTPKERARLIEIAGDARFVAAMRFASQAEDRVDPNWIAIFLAEGSPESQRAAEPFAARLAVKNPDLLQAIETYRGALAKSGSSPTAAPTQTATKPRRTARPMSVSHFWEIIDYAGATDDPAVSIREILDDYPLRDIKLFDRHFESAMGKAYRFDLWGAAYLRLGGCSDDAFSDFRADLISRGRDVFERVLKDPDTLADDLTDIEGNEDVLTVANEVYRDKTGRDLPHVLQKLRPTGKSWDFDDPQEMERRYPRLYKLFGLKKSAGARRR